MDLSSRHEVERAKWDAHAHHSHEVRDLGPEDIVPPDMTFARHSAEHIAMSGMADFLGDLDGRRVLEYGCGLGKLTVLLARSGAKVTSFDLSEASVEMARRRAELNGVADRIEFVVASGEDLPFADDSFDRVVGKAILHHLDPEIGARELARVLAPGGRATFSEPLGTNPFLVLARKYVPYPGKHERGADRPLTREDIAIWRAPFADARLRPIQLLSMVERGFGFHRTFPALRRLDEQILRRFPSTWRLAWYGILYLTASGSLSQADDESA